MQWLKFKIFFFLCLLAVNTLHAFDASSCFSLDFDIEISHKGWPFGLAENSLSIKKEKCNFYVKHTRLKYLETLWHVDVCREPVHIKKGNGAVEVIKRKGSCHKNGDSLFCNERRKIIEVIQDSGLIFADGVKEELGSDHGKVYCSYKMLSAYMKGSVLGKNSAALINRTEKEIDGKEVRPSEELAPRPVLEGVKKSEAEEASSALTRERSF